MTPCGDVGLIAPGQMEEKNETQGGKRLKGVKPANLLCKLPGRCAWISVYHFHVLASP